MIDQESAISMFLGTCPSFAEPWEKTRSAPGGGKPSLYDAFTALAQHLAQLAGEGKVDELEPTFELIERLQREGDAVVSEAASIGLLEDLQQAATRRGLDRAVFEAYLGPESREYWALLGEFDEAPEGPARER